MSSIGRLRPAQCLQSRLPVASRSRPGRVGRVACQPDAFADLSSISIDDDDKWREDKGSGSSATTNGQGIYISSTFDGGNVDVVNMKNAGDIQIKIHEDPFCATDARAHFQWFYFRVTGVKGQFLSLNIVNAGDASYPEGWDNYNACCSYDRVIWFRVPTLYDAETGILSIRHKPEHSSVYFAYFAPYSHDKHMRLVAAVQMSERAEVRMIGETLDGHDMDMLVLGDERPDKPKIWIIARQHPGETMAEWFVDGVLKRLVDRHDSVARDLLNRATLYIVPNMNPDGAWRGHLRTNAVGMNLNRCWDKPTLDECPEVYHVLRQMRETGVDMFVDVHGDEAIPHNFIACTEGIPGWTDQMQLCKQKFTSQLQRANPDFQTVHGYPIEPPGTANMSFAANTVAQEFDCFALVLEQPFKDCAENPDPKYGWNPARAKGFGGSFVTAIRQIVPYLRKEYE